MVHIPDKNTPRHPTKNNDIPGYLKWRHLTAGQRDSRLPNSILFLLRVITLTDSVISFNSAKRLTNTLETVCKTVSHLCKEPVEEMHYQQILWIFGNIYTYTPARFKEKLNLIVSLVEIENRLMVCEKRALNWIRKEYSGMNALELEADTVAEIDDLIKKDKNFKIKIFLENQSVDKLPPLYREKTAHIPQIETTPVEPTEIKTYENKKTEEHKPDTRPSATQKALAILERIKQRSQERKEQYIKLEQEKEKEIIKALHAIFTLSITSNKRSFPVEFIQKKVSIFAHNTIRIEDLLNHPLSKDLIRTKEADSTEYLLLDVEKYKTTHFE